ncbi:MAG: urea ABC transporter ATP-binding subunit UrtE [Spirochaetaceae bacterium]|nr:urea ABC transporter ATP-binding subunit UrtE [Spirochaetaceae bacterium]
MDAERSGRSREARVLEIQGLSAGYGESLVLREIDLSVAAGEIVAVVGRNGMGKSTLMRALMGIIPVAAGRIEVGGQDVTSMKSFERVAAGLGYVPQGRMIFGTMTVRENIEVGLASVVEKTIPEDVYELFPVLEEMADRRGGNLSGGQQQQLAIARALATRPRLLLLDEPTEGIQPSIILELARVLRRIRDQRGLGILVSEQVLHFALDVADRVIVLENGRITMQSTRDEVDERAVAARLAV